MTNKEKLIENLKKYNENFSEYDNDIIIHTYSPLITKVSFNNNSIDISSKLKGWNFLTGIMTMDFEKVLIYISIMSIMSSAILAFIILLDDDINSPKNLVILLIILFVIIWNALIYMNYRIKYENVRSRIIEWTK